MSGNFETVVRVNTGALVVPWLGHTAATKGDFDDQVVSFESLTRRNRELPQRRNATGKKGICVFIGCGLRGNVCFTCVFNGRGGRAGCPA